MLSGNDCKDTPPLALNRLSGPLKHLLVRQLAHRLVNRDVCVT